MSYEADAGWVVVLPVKSLARAKTRFADVTPAKRLALARAFALDTVLAVAAAPSVRVVVVTSDREAGPIFAERSRKVVLVIDQQRGMNAAVRQGARWAGRHVPDAGVAVIPADLPAATSGLVEVLLARASAHPRSVLADMEQVGTTALTALPGTRLRAAFGPDSWRSHRRSGAVPIEPSGLDRMRRDVDLVEHLEAALQLGVGPATRQAVDSSL